MWKNGSQLPSSLKLGLSQWRDPLPTCRGSMATVSPSHYWISSPTGLKRPEHLRLQEDRQEDILYRKAALENPHPPGMCAAKVKVRILQDKRTQTLRPTRIQMLRSVVLGKWSCKDSRQEQTFCEELSISDNQVTLRGDGLRLNTGASSRRLKAVVDDRKALQGTTVTQVFRKSRW